MPIRTSGGVFNDQMLTGSLSHYVVCGADFSGAVNSYGQPVPGSAAEIIFNRIESGAYVNIMNPNEFNLSFALEEGRSVWTEESLTAMIQSLGPDVGVDHIDCTVCVCSRVPYVWSCGTGVESFLDLSDTPDSYAGAAGYVVTVNPGETGLIFSPAPAGSNAFAFLASPSQPTISAIGADTLTLIAGTNMTITTDALLKTVTFDATGGGTGSNDYIPVPAGTALAISQKYFVTSAGTVTLPALDGLSVPGQSVTITKKVGITVLVDVGDPTDEINTDVGSTDQIEFDATQELVFVVSSSNDWELQIGSVL